jgi:hypothetical protein
VLLDGLDQRSIDTVIGVLNGEPLAYLKLSRQVTGHELFVGKIGKDGALPRRSVIQSLLGISPTNRRKFKIIDIPEVEKKKKRGRDTFHFIESLRTLAVSHLQKLVSPRIWRCAGCGKFFIAKDRRYRKYCVSTCGSKAEALKHVPLGRAARKAANLKRARDAQKLCPSDQNWKVFVARKTGLSKNFLTYAVRSGELEEISGSGV